MLNYNDNPAFVYPPEETIEQISTRGTWWVAHTKSRFEKAFAHDLAQRHIGYFLPMLEVTRISSGKRRRGLMPLFPSYVFLCGSEEERHQALVTDRLCQVIAVRDQERLTRELGDLQRALQAGAIVSHCPFMQIGRRCRVTSGAMEGIEGVVVEHAGVSRLVIEVHMLGQAALLQIDTGLLEPAEAPEDSSRFRRLSQQPV